MDPETAAHDFDSWYADMSAYPRKDEITRRHLGLPPEFLTSSFLDWEALAEVTDSLRLRPGDTLLDLACGRGGYGLEIARRTGARLIGIDFSGEAIRQATALADDLGRTAEFRVGELAATGLAAGSVDAVVCVDSIQFADPPEPAYAEVYRVLVPGGRAALTCWEFMGQATPEIPERLMKVNLADGLTTAGFADVDVRDRSEWRRSERSLWEEAAALDPGDDPALHNLHDEGVRLLGAWDSLRRVFGTAAKPTNASVMVGSPMRTSE